MSDHIVPFKTYFNVILVLIALTVVTVLVSLVDFGVFNLIISMGIATFKAALVLMYFMHLKYDDKSYLVIFLVGVFFLAIIFLFSSFDIITRVVEKSVL
ncbi:MAG: cytochrome C oxidase subunit IV family protein [Bdellovibrionales bacterium]|nr:cytochrome C oxidase subunit IV family protein [Bdellovibrionales bacterium]